MGALILNRKIMISPSAFPSAASQPVEAAKNPRGRKNGPTVRDHIVNAMSASTEKNGLSFVALKKALAARGYDTKKNNSRVKVAVQGLVSNGTLVRTKGSGVSGSFKLNTKTKTRARQAVSKAKKHVGRTVSKVKKPARKVSAKKRQSSVKRVSRGKKSAPVRRASSQAKKPARVSSAAKRRTVKKPSKAKRPRSRSSTKRSHKASSRASRSSAKSNG